MVLAGRVAGVPGNGRHDRWWRDVPDRTFEPDVLQIVRVALHSAGPQPPPAISQVFGQNRLVVEGGIWVGVGDMSGQKNLRLLSGVTKGEVRITAKGLKLSLAAIHHDI